MDRHGQMAKQCTMDNRGFPTQNSSNKSRTCPKYMDRFGISLVGLPRDSERVPGARVYPVATVCQLFHVYPFYPAFVRHYYTFLAGPLCPWRSPHDLEFRMDRTWIIPIESRREILRRSLWTEGASRQGIRMSDKGQVKWIDMGVWRNSVQWTIMETIVHYPRGIHCPVSIHFPLSFSDIIIPFWLAPSVQSDLRTICSLFPFLGQCHEILRRSLWTEGGSQKGIGMSDKGQIKWIDMGKWRNSVQWTYWRSRAEVQTNPEPVHTSRTGSGLLLSSAWSTHRPRRSLTPDTMRDTPAK